MSFCPYGVQAENAMAPVVDLLGTKADIKVRYIASVNGTTVDSVKSLHGLIEAKEDLRQLCIAKYYPQELWPYLADVNAQCYPVYKNTTQIESCQKSVTATLGIDNQKIETCAGGSEGLGLLKARRSDYQELQGYRFANAHHEWAEIQWPKDCGWIQTGNMCPVRNPAC